MAIGPSCSCRPSGRSSSWKWTDIGSYQKTELCQNPFLTLWFDHGTNAKDQTYAYAIVPNKSARQMQEYYAYILAMTLF